MLPDGAGVGGGDVPLERCAEVLALKAPLVGGADVRLTCGERGAGLVPEHIHDQLEVDLLFEPAVGAFSWWSQSGERHEESVFGPAVLIVGPHVLHACRWQKAADSIVMYLGPTQAETMFAANAPAFASLPTAAQDLALWNVANAVRSIYTERNPSEAPTLQYLGLALCHHAAELLHRIIPRPINRLAEEVVRKVREFISTHLAANIRTDDLAKAVNYSVAHLTALFKQAIGLTPTEFLFRLRMDKANELLRTGFMTIRQVAAKVGYVDPANFSEKFRAHWGYSAKHAIRQARLESANRPKIS